MMALRENQRCKFYVQSGYMFKENIIVYDIFGGKNRKRYRKRHEGFNNWIFFTLRRLAKLVFHKFFFFSRSKQRAGLFFFICLTECHGRKQYVKLLKYEIPKFRYHHFSGNFGPFELRTFQLLKTKEQMCIFAGSFLRVMPFIQIFCVFNPYFAIHNVDHCQV